MSDEDDNYVTFGVALDPLDEENVPRKKAVTIEDQYAYDPQGRRRFHGAFTGGFSAGYFNTVGTRDGWRPQQFKSSRSSKAENVNQRPEDFMDEEDTGQFGIAPQGIRATSDYADHGHRGVKRERINRDSGPIPGTPVLKELLKPVTDTVGITLLKKMGWKPGQGIGSRLTKKQKHKVKKQNERIRSAQDPYQARAVASSSDDSDNDHEDITFAPDDYEPFRCNPKDNFFGIGYSGLERRSILSGHINLFDTPAFSIKEKNKKLSIHGQAFGVGAFEADDEDIYAKEDMSRYDFALAPERKTKSRWSDDNTVKSMIDNCLEGFVHAKKGLEKKKLFPLPELPKDFVPVHAVRKSRFYPPIESLPHGLENGRRQLLTATDRARILDDTDKLPKFIEKQPDVVLSVASNIVTRTLNLHGKQQVEERQKLEIQQNKSTPSWMDKLNVQSFIKGQAVGGPNDSTGGLQIKTEPKSNASNMSPSEVTLGESERSSETTQLSVKPFMCDTDKQRRFEQYLNLLKEGEKHKLESMQPLSMTEWDREHERTEFEQAARLFGPGMQTNKFMPAGCSSTLVDPVIENDEVKQAARMKMFGKLTRERIEWKPASIVCKRFNIPEPKVGCTSELKKKATKFSIFDSLDWNSTSKFLKATDTVFKQHTEISSTAGEDNIQNTVIPESQANVITPAADKETAGIISEKMRNFEISYEKVFGKEVQETSTSNSAESRASETIKEIILEENIDQADGDRNKDVSAGTMAKDKSEEKKDLFKAIFLSSSEESDSEPEESVDTEALKSVLIGEVPSKVNTQRNTSPPRGIFAKVDLDNLIGTSKSHKKSNLQCSDAVESCNEIHLNSADRLNESHVGEATSTFDTAGLPNMYGPALPSRLIKSDGSALSAAEETPQSIRPVFRSVVVPKISTDSRTPGKWVERDKVKKSKKEKKKHKHKDHKSSKHKRKSRKDKR